MFTYHVKDKASGTLRYTYNAEEPINWNEFPFTDYDHIETPYTAPDAPPMPVVAPVILTKLQFLRRFTQAERITMRAAASASAEMFDYMELLRLAEEVVLNDPDTIAGVTMMEVAGIIGAGRAQEVLNG